MTSPEGQALIGNFKISGKVLFIPNANSKSVNKKERVSDDDAA